MNSFSKQLYAAFMSVVLLSSCSRPVAYFQPTHAERFTSSNIQTVATVTPAKAALSTERIAVVSTEGTLSAASQPVSETSLVQVNGAVEKLDAYVRSDTKLAASHKLGKRMDRMKQMLATTAANPAQTTNATAPTRKMTLVGRMAVKRLNNRIKDTLSPERPMAKSVLTIGLIIAVIGLILLLVNVAAPLGYIALVVGLVLVLLGLLGVV